MGIKVNRKLKDSIHFFVLGKKTYIVLLLCATVNSYIYYCGMIDIVLFLFSTQYLAIKAIERKTKEDNSRVIGL